MKKEYGKEAAIGQELYEEKVKREALERAGQNPQLKGVTHEILFRDKLNADPRNIVTGRHTELSKSPTAVRDDLVTMQGGKVVGRYQLKDTEKSIQHSIMQGSSGKYKGTQFMGTQETAQAYRETAARRVATGKSKPQAMTSTGISSRDTERIANKALGKNVSLNGMLSGAANAAKMGGFVSGGISVVNDLLDEEDHSCGEIVENAAKSGATGIATGAAGVMGAEVALNMVTNPFGQVVAPIIGGVAAANLASRIVAPTVEGIADAIRFGDPSFATDGLVEGLDEAGGAVLETIGTGVDLLCDGLDAVSDFLDRLFW